VCSIDTGNKLNASVVNFSESEPQTAKIMVTAVASSPGGNKPVPGHVTITAYTVSGEESKVVIPVE
jgi:hypothetical protein